MSLLSGEFSLRIYWVFQMTDCLSNRLFLVAKKLGVSSSSLCSYSIILSALARGLKVEIYSSLDAERLC